MKCPVCKKTLNLSRPPYFGATPKNRRDRLRMDAEFRNTALKRYTEVKTKYDGVLGVPHRWESYHMHPDCAKAYEATVRLLISTGEIKKDLFDFFFTKFSSKNIINAMYGTFGKSSLLGVTGYSADVLIVDDAEANTSDLNFIQHAFNKSQVEGVSLSFDPTGIKREINLKTGTWNTEREAADILEDIKRGMETLRKQGGI